MRKVVKFAFTCAFLFTVFLFGKETACAAELKALVPTERAVYQRNDKNKADMLVRAEYEEGKKVVASLWTEDGTELSEEIVLTATDSDHALYEGTIPNVPAGGWYRLGIQAVDPGTGQEESQIMVEKIGVGEVFITGGQSNSCSFGATKTVAEEDRISAFDPKNDVWQHCEDPQPCISGFGNGNGNGSPWPSAGDELYAQLQVPIGFITTGFGGSTVSELLNPHYDAIKDAIETLKPYGYRSFLYHQGEHDASGGTKRDEYAALLTELIQKTRTDAGYDLFWMVANAAYTPYTSETAEKEVLEGQKMVCDEKTIFLGPYTDDMTKGCRASDNLHFNETGLKEHGRRWAEAIVQKMIPDYASLPTEPPATATPTTVPSLDPTESQTPSGTTSPTAAAAPTLTPAPVPSASPGPETTADPKEKKETTSSSYKGKSFKNGIIQYKITSDSKSSRKVTVTSINGKNKKSITIPKKVKYKKKDYRIRSIKKSVWKKLKKLRKVKVPSSIYKTCKKQLKGKKVTIKKY